MSLVQRVEIPPYLDRWMMGDRYGKVVSTRMKVIQRNEVGMRGWVNTEVAKIKLEISGKTISDVILDHCRPGVDP